MSSPFPPWPDDDDGSHCLHGRLRDGCQKCRVNRQAPAGAYWLGMLGFALAAPAATERAWYVVFDTERCVGRDVEPHQERGAVAFRNEALKAISSEDEP
jgi:hypothetical protein